MARTFSGFEVRTCRSGFGGGAGGGGGGGFGFGFGFEFGFGFGFMVRGSGFGVGATYEALATNPKPHTPKSNPKL